MCPDRLGRTCAHLACGSHLAGGGGATAGPRPRVLRELLRGPGGGAVDLQARDYEGLTPLHVAVASGSRESVLLLLEHGADVDAGDIKSGRSPLLHAVENDSLEMAELLLQHGASVNAQSYAGCTALHAAAGRGLLRLLRLLLRCGADCGLRNLHNDTAAAVAVSAQVGKSQICINLHKLECV
ncbi:B-cell lymphoma 3 protein homolog [Melospiza melodia melodia]|uniref:B-cell lymphoma 3 protein homolog n=1 Tax=Melospiza melodia melodia TaxID=1914991 RepID=UPI002FCFD712